MLTYKRYCEIKNPAASEAEYEAYVCFCVEFCDPAEKDWQRARPLLCDENVSLAMYSAFIVGYATAKGRLDEMFAAAKEMQRHIGRTERLQPHDFGIEFE